MRRAAAILTAVAALTPGAVALAQKPQLAAKMVACESGPDATDRFAVFTGSMPTEPGVAVMAMRLDLFERQPGTGFGRVSLPNWGEWEKTTRRNAPGFI